MSVIRCAAGVAALLLASAGAPAQTYTVIPGIYADAEGPAGNNALVRHQGSPYTSQFVYSPTALATLVNFEITGLTFRSWGALPGGYPFQVTTTWADYRISLGPAVAPSAVDSTTFANNFTAPPTLVRSGPLTVLPNAWPHTGPGPEPWGVEITFDRPYLYTGGNLAILVSHPGSDNPDFGNNLMNAASSTSPGYGVDYAMLTGPGFNASTGTINTFPTILRLTGIAVPEPRFALLGAAALVPLASLFRRKLR
jgi:hypothetical protein